MASYLTVVSFNCLIRLITYMYKYGYIHSFNLLFYLSSCNLVLTFRRSRTVFHRHQSYTVEATSEESQPVEVNNGSSYSQLPLSQTSNHSTVWDHGGNNGARWSICRPNPLQLSSPTVQVSQGSRGGSRIFWLFRATLLRFHQVHWHVSEMSLKCLWIVSSLRSTEIRHIQSLRDERCILAAESHCQAGSQRPQEISWQRGVFMEK